MLFYIQYMIPVSLCYREAGSFGFLQFTVWKSVDGNDSGKPEEASQGCYKFPGGVSNCQIPYES